MASRIKNQNFKINLLDFIDKSDLKALCQLKATLEDTDNETNEYPSKPGEPSLKGIKDVTEKAFQRAVYNAQKIVIDYGESKKEIVQWWDFELPVVFNSKSRRPCLDLIGTTMDDIPVICELKYSDKSNSDHPIYGAVELIMYYYYILCNHKVLDKYDIHHKGLNKFKWSSIADITFPKLLLVANEKYWKYWLERIGKKSFMNQVLELCEILNVKIDCCVAKDEEFRLQKGENDEYTPIITSTTWVKVK